ncbi:MAG: sugar ABC transporter permease [Bacteroidetes bacterium]|jgi:putative chitobiose transport system permease protein|nr:sugar ABC transporter permease [Bacteroidota bacterium]
MSRRSTIVMFLAPAGIFLILFTAVPFLEVIRMSFERHSFVREPAWVGLEHYLRLLDDPSALAALGNSLIYLLVTPVVILLSLGLALLLRSAGRSSATLRLITFLPVLTPMVVAGIIWRWVFQEDVGLFNAMLLASGAVSTPVPWLTSYPLNLATAMSLTVWKGLGYYGLIFLAGLTAIPKEVEESAELEGAVGWMKFWHVILPMMRPTVIVASIISGIAALKVFDELYVLSPHAPAAQKTIMPLIYQMAFVDLRYGPAAALSVMLFLGLLALSVLQMRMWRDE